MALAIAAGIFCGLLGLLPMVSGLAISRRMDAQESAAGYAAPVLLAIGGSFVVLLLATVICLVAARDVIVPFACAEAATLVVAALAFGTYQALKK